MDIERLLKKEKHAVVKGQSVRFRIIKYIVLFCLFAAVYAWKGGVVLVSLIFILLALSIAVHFFFRWKTQGWEKSWGPFKTPYLD